MVALVSKNCGARFTVPVTVAPARVSAVVMPVTEAVSAPGAVTSTTR